MEHPHQLVNATNFIFCLMLVLSLRPPPVTPESSASIPTGNTIASGEQTGTDGSNPAGATDNGTPPIAGPPAMAVGMAGRDRSHLKVGSGACSRFVFNSSRIRNGSITPVHSKHSGIFPSSLCQLYEFVGTGAERVQIIFSEFRLPSKQGPSECGDTDILMVYYIVDEREELVETLCGDTLPKPILSEGPRLLLEFRSSYNNTENKGFTGDFLFLTNFGIPTGHQPNQSECTFHYFRNASSQGWIQSPNFPGAYPRNIVCHYFFHGGPQDQVNIRFTYFDIEGILPCDEDSASDYVEFSNFNTRDRKYVLYCGHWRELSVRSDGRYFRITMASNDRLDGTGFRALYNFETAQQQQQQVTTEQNAVAAKSASGKVMSSAASRLQHIPGMSLGLPLLVRLRIPVALITVVLAATVTATTVITTGTRPSASVIRIIGLELIKILQD
ncbi:suppressor of lurcher protein 1-like [Anopheles albimanus]|uniref:CUB domain-containing protein n=1 Tax=Anopheles albimanus TaxID=7167 RepID=A0A8W7JCN8_ANOAL|nr:suppressor of lurcher protein 1-like [Anopheles albimanus]XP_035774140.1 suppressor of lurcher protein 1-like [Anopheles albimanus]